MTSCASLTSKVREMRRERNIISSFILKISKQLLYLSFSWYILSVCTSKSRSLWIYQCFVPKISRLFALPKCTRWWYWGRLQILLFRWEKNNPSFVNSCRTGKSHPRDQKFMQGTRQASSPAWISDPSGEISLSYMNTHGGFLYSPISGHGR